MLRLWIHLYCSFLLLLTWYHHPLCSANEVVEAVDTLYPEVQNCFLSVPRPSEEKTSERIRNVNEKCGATHQNGTSLCFKICVLSKLHLIGKDSPMLNEDIMKNPDKYNELTYQRLMAVEYRPVNGPVWALVALKMLGISYTAVSDPRFDREKYLMKVRMEKCNYLRFQIPLSEKKGCVTSKNTPQPEKWNSLIECVENALKC